MTPDEAIAWWYGRIDFERKPAKPGDLKLDRMRALLQALGDPHQRLRIVHVAGTKGKGSTSAMLASVLQAAGYCVGLFTSPHLSDVAERIQVDGVPIDRNEIAARMAEVARATLQIERGGDVHETPTFFEVGTALGFLHFVCRQVDVAIVEVGLGGQFDSTNVCEPILSIITNISFDHMAQLGDRLALIAREKAGIIKQTLPVITTAEAPEALEVIEQIAREQMAPLCALGREFGFEYRAGRVSNKEFRVPSSEFRVPSSEMPRGYQLPQLCVLTARRTWPWMELGLLGQHQAANAAGAVAAVEALRLQGLAIDDKAVAEGLANIRWPARLEIIGNRPLTVLDCAHNVASAQALVDTLRDTFDVAGPRRLIFAVSSDKQADEMLEILAPCFDHFYLTRYGNNPRCLPPETAAAMLRRAKSDAACSLHENAVEALNHAREQGGPVGLIVITGSVFLAGELRPLLVGS
jgi:dihydrofolate synthase / folylpolyglutamate synthase